ncbi:MAG: T9SS type A sorting domain-containing protein [Bacteroidia bacterium]|nr:T9SS type A sorting domain-containing protein [Bacteroidia bacterium]
MKNLFTALVVFLLYSDTFAQSAEWKYFRPSNTGVGAEEHNFISEDRFGNIWTSGRSAIQGEGSVVRFNHRDTIFTCWSNFEGFLPGQFIYAAEVDNKDDLWVATEAGLCKYDGINWVTYDTTNTPLPSHHIRSITLDSQNNVWITFQEVNYNIGGIARFDGSNWAIYTPQNSALPNYTCYNILIDSQNNKWIHSLYSVTKFDGVNFTDYNWQNSGLYGPQVYDIALDSADRLYALTDLNGFYMQLNVFDGTTWSYINHTNTPAMNNYLLSNIDIKDDKIIMAEGGGSYAVIIYDGNSWTTYFGGDIITDVFIDKDDNYWVSGISTLSKLENGQWRDYMRYSTGLAEHNNYDIFVDSHDRLWAANGNGGFQVFDCPKWQSYGPWNQGLYPSPQSLSTVGASTCEDSEGNIWIAYHSTNGTVVKIPGGDYQNYAAWETYDLSNSPISWIDASIADGFGNVFFYSDYGTHMYNNSTGTWKTWDLTNSPLQYYSYGFGRDSSGKVYFAGFQQLSIYNNGVWDSVNLPAIGANISVANDIAFDSQNNMWLATDEGVWKYDGTNWTNWTASNSTITDNHVSSIIINKNDSVFVSSYHAQGFFYGGISIFDGVSWKTFNISNSDLPSEQIDDMELDTRGNLWINTFTKGVTVYRKGGVSGFDCMDYSLQTTNTTGISPTIYPPNLDIKAYPNPFSSIITLEITASETKAIELSVVDVLGREVKTLTSKMLYSGKNEITLDLSILDKGIYFCRVKSGENDQTLKLVKRE